MPSITAYLHAYVPTHNAGAETTIHDLLKYLVTKGWEANVVLKPANSLQVHNEEYDIDGVHVIRKDKRTLLHYVPRSDITISHLECSSRLHIASNSYKVPTVHLVHNTHPLTKQWSASSDALIFNTEWIRDSAPFVDWNAPSLVINPPVDPREYETDRGKRLGQPARAITLVNLWEDKGSRVFYELARRNPELSFIGVKGGYGEQVIEELPNVKILEHTSDMKSVYSQSKLILMPSKYESFGRVAVEAMASGIPTIAHPTPGLQEALGTSGMFADREDADAWQKSLTDALKPAKYGKLSKAAKARSEELAKQREHQLSVLDPFLREVIRKKTGKVF